MAAPAPVASDGPWAPDPAAVPLALYVHVPWCVRKCPYCDFNSHGLRGEPPWAAYVDALLADLDREAADAAGRPVTSIFLGGGTPSLMPPDQVARLLTGVRARVALAPEAEITLEANPGTVEAARFEGFREAGVGRLSIGVQSFQDRLLAAIGRIHGAAEARGAVAAARAAGFDDVNLDLMFALPGQSLAEARADVEAALELEVPHVSHYQLTLEPNTRFHARPPPLPDPERAWEMQEACHGLLAGAGLRRYEVSAWARPGRECRHNRNYWEYGDYLGIGAGAHGKLTRPGRGVVRRVKRRGPSDYLRGVGARREWAPTPAERLLEVMMNGLRLAEGIPADLPGRRAGLPPGLLAGPVAQARARGLLDDSGGRLRATPLGARFLDDLLTLFVPGG